MFKFILFFEQKVKKRLYMMTEIKVYVPIDLYCQAHPDIPLNLFCVKEKGKSHLI